MKKLLRKVIEEYVALSYNPRIVFKNFVLPFYIHVPYSYFVVLDFSVLVGLVFSMGVL